MIPQPLPGRPESLWSAERMSFLRHEQIYQSDVFFPCARGEAVSRFALASSS